MTEYRDTGDPLDYWRDDHWTSHPPRVAAYAAEADLIAALFQMRAAYHPTSLRDAVLDSVMAFLGPCDCEPEPESAPKPEPHRRRDRRRRPYDTPLDDLDGWMP